VPPDDYTLVTVNGFKINARTYAMLQYAAQLYGGEIDVAGKAITQGSYSNNGPASFGTHLGGGAVDISVIRLNSDHVLYAEIEPLVLALRVAGFAAWLRDWGELGEGAGIHIHAVAIGDKDLSPEAQEQLTGEFGYFRGFSGVPQSDGVPVPDRHNGPLVCQWMIEAGYEDLRTPSQIPATPPPGTAWQESLAQAALAYHADTAEEADAVARQLHYLDGKTESASLMCGPLAAAILRDAGLLPNEFGPIQDLHSYWLANPKNDGRPWTLFAKKDYELFQFTTPIKEFDFLAWPLRPGDFVYTYSRRVGFEHMFIVTEVDEEGRAYTVTNQYQLDKTYRIQRYLLYDPADPAAGMIQNELSNPRLGRTGLIGFDVLRRRGVGLPPGSLFAYLVQPGDTLLSIVGKFYTTPQGIAAVNAEVDLTRLIVGQTLLVPVSTAEIPAQPSSGADLQTQVEAIVASAPSGQWGVYIENLSTGEVITLNAEEAFHPASTIKLAIGIAMMNYLDTHTEVTIRDGPGNRARSFEQLLQAMLIPSEEAATAMLLDYLNSQDDVNLQEQVESWGALHTTIEPRSSTPADLALLWKRLYLGELLTEESTAKLLEILRTPSAGDELRIGGGLPEAARAGMAHKTGTTFEKGLGVVADTAVVEAGDTAYVIVVLSSKVNWVDFDEALNLIAQISRAVYSEYFR
jgi:beta-lactamase class A